MNIVFSKTGREIKAAIQKRCEQLQQRLEKRNQVLDEFLNDKQKVRSYLLRPSENYYSHGGSSNYLLYSQNDISSEQKQQIDQLCKRIFDIEQELQRLKLMTTHLADDQVFELGFNDLIAYGFEANLESEME
ncbi:hypothetical protein H6S82_04720 [Planktothrix sp. FACHB-1355]|uniref:Uncharacterized protein n=1 Tax=Aerosakkonema funiforme FACHB-1375 TaxID=2949571 RepID=A0A926VK58_9CYAN|nr:MULTISPECIES: hypothetical protein [Oscillatoriales]MBD2185455.1 hypothetical protein [Aerosakkonema funiforme FACHB-1375]MBD3558157.1 hypothetical protein [Planktothrix sp. FACHB-1355]